MASKREEELDSILRQLVPAVRDVLWCALVWNDHNFDDKALCDHAQRAANALGYQRAGLGDHLEAVNKWLARVDKVLEAK